MIEIIGIIGTIESHNFKNSNSFKNFDNSYNVKDSGEG